MTYSARILIQFTCGRKRPLLPALSHEDLTTGLASRPLVPKAKARWLPERDSSHVNGMVPLITAPPKHIIPPAQSAAPDTCPLPSRTALPAATPFAAPPDPTSQALTPQTARSPHRGARHGLPSHQAGSLEQPAPAPDQAALPWLTTLAQQRRQHLTTPPPQGLARAPSLRSPPVQAPPCQRDAASQHELRLSPGPLSERFRIPSQGEAPHTTFLGHGATIGNAPWDADRSAHQVSPLAAVQIQGADPTPVQRRAVGGMEVRTLSLAGTSTSTGQASVHAGNRLREPVDHPARLRTGLQKKGPRGARRRVRPIGPPQRRGKLPAPPASPAGAAWLGRPSRSQQAPKAPARQAEAADGPGTRAGFAQGAPGQPPVLAVALCKLQAVSGQGPGGAGGVAGHRGGSRCSREAVPLRGSPADASRSRRGWLLACQHPSCGHLLSAERPGARKRPQEHAPAAKGWEHDGVPVICL
jgi:hypothetical protein